MIWNVYNYKSTQVGKVEADSEDEALRKIAEEKNIPDDRLDSSGYYVLPEHEVTEDEKSTYFETI